MSQNKQIASRFKDIASLLELTGADKFRVNAHSRVARVLGDLTDDIASIAQDRTALLAIDGVGAKAADKIQEYLDTGEISERVELLEQVPSGLLDVLKIPGLGPKTVRLLWQEKNVTDLDQLQTVIDDGSILELPRMGAKTVENIKKAMDFARQAGGRTPIGIATPIAEDIVAVLKKAHPKAHIEIAGSLRRGAETIGDLDLLVASKEPEAVAETFRTMPIVDQVLAAGATKSSVRIKAQDSAGAFHLLQADLRIVPLESFGAALMYFTGSKHHNVKLRERALKQGLTLNEYGLFPNDDNETPPQQRGVKPVASKREDDVYSALELPFVPAELREDRGELDIGSKRLSRLLELKDIKADLHAHTTASDGVMSIEELAAQAKSRGFHTIAVTDHSKSQPVANGLSPERLLKHIDAVREADANTKGIHILIGSEVDILADGSLDYDDDLLARLDVVVASPHWALTQDPKTATARLLKAIEHPLVHIIGHPTGRLINRREGLSPALPDLIAAAKEHKTALEINAHWMRLDLRDTHVRAAADVDCLIAINCDAHSPTDFDNLRYGVQVARRGWMSRDQCVSAWTQTKLHAWLKSKR